MSKIIIAGGRDFTDYDLLINTCDDILIRYDNIELVGGGCPTCSGSGFIV